MIFAGGLSAQVNRPDAASGYTDPLTTQGDIVVRGAAATTRLAIGTNGQVLKSNGTSPAWAADIGFADPMTTRGDMIYRNAANTTARLPVGADGQVITTDGTDIFWGSAGDTSYYNFAAGLLSTKAGIDYVETAELHDRGINWTARSAAKANAWWSVTYGNGLFVAVSYAGTNRVMTSPDGITWTARSAAEANQWRSVTYGNGLFVAVSDNGTNRVMTSPNGITWTARSAAEVNQWYSVTYGNGLFVAVSYGGTNRVMTSPDGITWTARSAEESGWASVTYGNGLFVAVSDNGTNRVMTSGKQEININPHNNIYKGGMKISGNVGIGTTSPSAKLDVDGDIEIAGDTSVTAVKGKIVFQAADSSFYGCRSTTAAKKWYKLH